MIDQLSNLLTTARTETTGAIELLIGWRAGDKIDGGLVLLGKDVAAQLRAAAIATLDWMDTARPRPYFDGSALEKDEILVAGRDEVPDDDALLSFVATPTNGLTSIPAEELTAHKALFYAARFAHGNGFSVFVNKVDPQISAKSGSFYSVFGGEGLIAVEQPLFQFRRWFEVLAIEQVVVASGTFAFDQLFREVPLGRVGAMAAQLAANLPLADGSAAMLEEAAMASARVRNRLRILLSRSHVALITIPRLRAELQRHGVAEDGIIGDGQMVFDPARPTLLLELLDEDLWRGGFSGTLFASERKAPRS